MAISSNDPSLLRLLAGLVTVLVIGPAAASAAENKKVYIAYMGELPSPENGLHISWLHANMLQQVSEGGSFDSKNLLHSYQRSFNGFAARLTEVEAERLAGMDGVVSVFPSGKNQLHTTRSWDFMGFPQNVERTNHETDLIVGVLDSGVWPESASFNDEGFGPPPAKWRGTCQSSRDDFTCNKKLIGAKAYNLGESFEEASPRDTVGHGTHTASTAAGNSVVGASLYGLGSGTARGGVPSARIAAYKICGVYQCSDHDILAAFDDAIADGVDLISISIGSFFPRSYFQDVIAIGSFHAMKNGILTSSSAGNNGPVQGSVCNFSPWSLTVAASTIDRKFVTDLQLGNNGTFQGISINTFRPPNRPRDFIYAGDAPNTQKGFDRSQARLCEPDSLDHALVKGKIVFCDAVNGGATQFLAGAAGTIMQDDSSQDVALNFPLPASALNLNAGAKVLSYLNSTSKPTAMVSKTISIRDEQAPKVASFSSRGPSPITADILKPDVTAPGVDILAAWSEAASLSGVPGDRRLSAYNILSGTSMSCPHATGAAAYVKSFHPTWSPAAIKSALMTTAFPMNAEDAELGYGSGHINPTKAIDPGLIYDAGVADYVKFLCGQNYSTAFLRLVTGDNSTCSESNQGTVWDLNYPSFTLSSASPGTKVTRLFHRTVTNVGLAVSTYKAVVSGPSEMKIRVEPSVLRFTALGEKSSFVMTVEASLKSSIMSGSLTWEDGVHRVPSPIVAHPFSLL